MSVLLKKPDTGVLKSQVPRLAPIENHFKKLILELKDHYEPRLPETEHENRLPQVNKITLTSPDGEDDRPHVHLKIFDVPVYALLDSGSHRTMFNSTIFKRLSNVRLQDPAEPLDLVTASGDALEIAGEVLVPYTFQRKTRVLPTLFVPGLAVDCICGIDFWRAYRIRPTVATLAITSQTTKLNITVEDPPILTDKQKEILNQVRQSFKLASPEKLDTTPLIEHEIILGGEFQNSKPVRQYPYPISPKIQAGLFSEIDRLLARGIIEESNSDWSLNIVPIRKSSGDIRLCLDARKLNERTIRDAYPLPHPGRILGRLPQARFLSTIDLTEAFLQIPLARGSRKYCAFSVQGKGMFQFTRLPFGLINSPATLARLMNRVLGQGVLEPNVFVYLDDIVIVTETFEEHIRLLNEVARRLIEANLSIKLEKSHFCVAEIPFLGYILSPRGLHTNPEKIRPIVEYERPTTVTKLRRFLGMSNYYRRFIADYSRITAPLSELLKSNTKNLKWSVEAEEAFQNIKEKLITTPILASANFDHEFIIHTDASDQAIAGVLTQEIDGREHVIEYYSKKLTTPERSYHATEKEALAALLSIEHFRGYVEGSHFCLVTDSSALTFIMRTKWKTSSRLSRWSLTLQQFDLTILHRRGKDNVVPDALSRSVLAVSMRSDSDWYNTLKRKVMESPEDYPDFKVEDEQLMKFVFSSYPTDHRFDWKIVPAPEARKLIIASAHDDAMHIGVDKTIGKIRQKYYWPRLTSDVRLHVQKCAICKEIKPANAPTVPLMGDMRPSNQPWQIIALDYIGPLPRTKSGKQYILVVMDLFSKWTQLHAFPSISVASLKTVLRDHWFFRNSVPSIVLSDNASTFTSKEFGALLENYGVKHWLTSRYHSQANPVERVNRSINTAIRSYARDDQRSWDTKLSEIEMIINSTVHSATGYSPFLVAKGQEVIVDGRDYNRFQSDEELSLRERVDRIRETSPKIFDLVAKNLKSAYNLSSQRYNLRHRKLAKPLNVGDKVYKRNTKQSNANEFYNAKLAAQYLPCTVVEKHGSSSYELVDSSGRNIGIWPANLIKSA